MQAVLAFATWRMRKQDHKVRVATIRCNRVQLLRSLASQGVRLCSELPHVPLAAC